MLDHISEVNEPLHLHGDSERQYPLQEMAVKIVKTILKQNTHVGSLEKVDMLFDFIQPLTQDAEGEEEDSDDEVGKYPLSALSVKRNRVFF